MNEEHIPKINIKIEFPSRSQGMIKKLEEEVKALCTQFTRQRLHITSVPGTIQLQYLPNGAAEHSRHLNYGEFVRRNGAGVCHLSLTPSPERMEEIRSQQKLDERKKEVLYASCAFSTHCRELLCAVEPTRDTCQGCREYEARN